MMEVYLQNLKVVNNKQDYVSQIFPFFIRTMNEAARRFNRYKHEPLENLELYQKSYVQYFEKWGS
jgi:hypothetical protein